MKVFCREELLLLGDFNICVDVVDDNDVMKFFDLLEFFGFVQYVEYVIYVYGYILDLIILCKLDIIIYGVFCIDCFLFDYGVVYFIINFNRLDIIVKIVLYRKLKFIDMNVF